MTKEDEFNTLNEEVGEWSRDEAIVQSFMEAREQAEMEDEERALDEARKIIMKFKHERSNENDQ